MSHPEASPPAPPYFRSSDPAAKHANQALARLLHEGLLPLPQNFELWYAYYAQTKLEVVRALDTLLAKQQPITDAQCEGIHQLFLSESKHNDSVRETGARIQATISGMSSRVDEARTATQHYNQALQAAADRLQTEAGADEIRSTVRGVLENTSAMMSQNQQLEEALAQSSLLMQGLERDLEEVRRQSLTDGLTALANRKAFDNEIARLSQLAQQGGGSFCLLMLDIDHFKVFNDTYGHPVGDEVLRLVARTLGQGVRSGDMAARYGGEEFAILLPGTSLEGALTLANALRVKIEGMALVRRKSGDKLGRVTLSGGLAEVLVGESTDTLIARADAALYQAKHRGRNRIEAKAPAHHT